MGICFVSLSVLKCYRNGVGVVIFEGALSHEERLHFEESHFAVGSRPRIEEGKTTALFAGSCELFVHIWNRNFLRPKMI